MSPVDVRYYLAYYHIEVFLFCCREFGIYSFIKYPNTEKLFYYLLAISFLVNPLHFCLNRRFLSIVYFAECSCLSNWLCVINSSELSTITEELTRRIYLKETVYAKSTYLSPLLLPLRMPFEPNTMYKIAQKPLCINSRPETRFDLSLFSPIDCSVWLFIAVF